MAGKGGGAWKVAYADFVTAMMAFFMVMWLTSQKPEVKQAVAGYFRDPFAIEHGNETGGADEVAARREEKDKNSEATDSYVRSMAPSGTEIDSRLTITFKEDLAKLDEIAQRSLTSFAPTVVGKLNRIEVRAHCLRRPLPEGSPYKDRWDLCYARSQTVRDELEKLGVEPQRIRLSQAEGNEPLSYNLAASELILNSRVDVILLPDYADIPWKKAASDLTGPATSEAAAETASEAPSDGHSDAHADGHDEGHAEPAAHDAGGHH